MERPSEPLLREIVAHLPYVATIIDPECRLLWVNQIDPAVPLESVIGQPIDGSIHEDHRAAFVALVRDSFATGESGYREVRAFLRTEGWRWYGVQIVPIAGEGERRALMLGIDVTERREAIAAIEASEARFRAVTVALPEVLTVVDGEGRILQTNRPTPDEAFGASIVEYAAPEDRERVREALESLFAGAEPAPFDTRSAHDGRVYENRLLRLPPEGDEPRALCISLDVTERREADRRQRELEAQLIEAQKMESLGQLAGGVAHDFNNLLSAIRLSAYLARSGGPEALVELDAITATVDRAEHLVRQLLAYPARTRRRPQIVDPVAEVTARRPLLETLLSTRGRLELELSVGAGVFSIDPGDLEQILVNLLVNARDALSQDGGEVRVLVRRRELPEGAFTTVGGQPSPAGSWVLLEVHDDGEGIAPEHRDAIFEPFFSTKPRGKGSGLGLASVGEAVRRAEGWLALESQEGVGTRVRVAFPPVEGLDSARPPSRPAPAPGRRVGRLLVAEEDPGLRCALARLLRVVGHDVEEVDSEARAVARLSEERLDLALASSSLAPALREQTTPLLVLAEEPHDPLEQVGVRAPVVGVLRKPFDVERLFDAIGQVLG